METIRGQFYRLENYFMGALSTEFVQFSEGIALYISRDSHPFFNFIYLHESADETVLLLAKTYMEARCHHYLIIVDENIGARLMPAVSTLGIKFDAITTAMALNLQNFSPSMIREKHSIQCVNHDLQPWLVPLQSAFDMYDATLAQQYLNLHCHALKEGCGMYHFVLQQGDEPITALTLTLKAGLARLDDIGTVTSYQRQGYASRMIHYALQFAQLKGAKHCFLEASEHGLSLYQKIGFQPIFNYYSFVYK